MGAELTEMPGYRQFLIVSASSCTLHAADPQYQFCQHPPSGQSGMCCLTRCVRLSSQLLLSTGHPPLLRALLLGRSGLVGILLLLALLVRILLLLLLVLLLFLLVRYLRTASGTLRSVFFARSQLLRLEDVLVTSWRFRALLFGMEPP